METPVDAATLQEFGTKYTAAWCSQNAADVAACFADDGSLKINDGEPSVGRAAITAAATAATDKASNSRNEMSP